MIRIVDGYRDVLCQFVFHSKNRTRNFFIGGAISSGNGRLTEEGPRGLVYNQDAPNEPAALGLGIDQCRCRAVRCVQKRDPRFVGEVMGSVAAVLWPTIVGR